MGLILQGGDRHHRLITMRRDTMGSRIANLFLPMVIVGCATVEAPVPPTQLPEVRPGYVAGYLLPEQLPDTLALVGKPPAPGSPQLAADEDAYKMTRQLRDSPRWAQAAKDAELRF